MKKLLVGVIAALAVNVAQAGPISWVDWTSATSGVPGSASGNIGSIGVEYTGDVVFAQLGAGINYWSEGTPAPYTGNAVVDNAPTPAEMIAMASAGVTNTITFDTAVLNPIMAIVSQGRYSLPVTYDFDQSFTVLSEGRGYWGDGSYTLGAGDTLRGYELHGVIQFNGLFSSISWQADRAEYWHGFTFGIGDQSNAPTVPTVTESSPAILLALALFGLSLSRGRRS